MKHILKFGMTVFAILTFPYGMVKAYKYAMQRMDRIPGHINYLWE